MARAEFERVDEAAWRAAVEKGLRGAAFEETLRTELLGGVTLEPLYTQADAGAVGWPGVAPFRRGGRAAAPDLGLPWVLAARFDDADLDRLATTVLPDLEGGATGLWLRLDRAARLGTDPAASDVDVGVGGAPIHGVADLERAFAGVEPVLVHWILDAGVGAPAAADVLVAWLRERGVDLGRVQVALGADPLGGLARDGALPGGLDAVGPALRRLVERCDDELPRGRALRASAAPWLEAGATPVTALGLALAAAVDHLRRLDAAGVPPARVAPRLAFEVALDRDVFTEVAGLRALRVCWARIQRAAGVDAPGPAWIHAYPADRLLTRQDPWVNLLRATTGTFAAIVGGADAISTPAFDQPLGASDALGRRIARNTQNILGEESHLGRVVDPAGGAYAFEALTDQVARRAWAVLQAVEAAGGLEGALTSGWVHRRVASELEARRAAFADGRAELVGVTRYAPKDPRPVDRAPRRSAEAVEAAVRRAREATGGGPRLAPREAGGAATEVAPLLPTTDEALAGAKEAAQ